MITMIWCEDLNHGIGKNNQIPWKIKEEMNHFRSFTTGHILVSGRRTMESLNNKPLPNRTHLVLTRNHDYHPDPRVKVYHDYQQILKDYQNQDLIIIGGKDIYQLFLPYADQLVISTLNQAYDCDLYMKLDLSNFNKFKSQKHDLFTINWYNRKK